MTTKFGAPGWIGLALLLLSTAALADLPPEDREWRAVETPNFELFGDASEARMKHIGNSLERLKSILDHLGTRGATPPVPTYVFVFRDRESFVPYGPMTADGKPKERIGGFFHRKPYGNFMAVQAFYREQSIRTVLHELVHFFVRYNLPDAPLWFNEGLAEFYSTFEVVDPYIHTGKILETHLHWLQQNQMLPLSEVFAVDHGSPAYNEKDRRGVFYAQSWLLVHYLLLGTDEGPGQVLDFLELQRRMPMEEAFAQAFKTTPEKLQKKLRRYQKSSRFTYRRAKLEVDDLTKSFRTRTLSRAETLARLGELVAGSLHKRAVADEHLKAALALDSKQLRAYVGLGYQSLVRFSDGPQPDYDAAVQHFATAKTLTEDDRLLDYLVAWARKLRGDPPESLKRTAIRTVNANPNLAAAWRLLTWVYEDSTDDLENKIRAYEGAFRLMPDDMKYAQALIPLYRKVGRTENAQYLVDRVLAPRGLSEGEEALLTFDDASFKAEQAQAGQQALSTGELMEQATALLSGQKYNEALEIYERLHHSLPDNQNILAKLEELREVVAHNRFVSGYNQAVELFGRREWRLAVDALSSLVEQTTDPTRKAKAEKLLAQAQEQLEIRGESG